MKKKIIVFPAILAALVFPLVLVSFELTNNHDVQSYRETEWAIGIYQGDTPIEMSDAEGVSNPVIKASDVTDVKAKFVADPFIIKKDSIYFMFFEVFNVLSGQGDIGVAASDNLKKWKYRKIVLDEPFHVSYPFVFKWQNDIYMIPESAEAKEVRLYKAEEFPYKWKFVKTLLKGDFGDHSLLRYNDVWWLFVGADPTHHSSLRLFLADSLFGQFKEHQSSPIIKHDASRARPGGRMIVYNDKIYRFAQDCHPTYGSALNAFEVTQLTKEIYNEKPINVNPVLKANGKGWARHGMHQLDPILIDNKKWFACVDGYKKEFIIKVGY